jgi:hypothetical protein
LPIKVAFVITTGTKWEEGGLVSIVMFFIFVAVVVICTLSLCYDVSSFEERSNTRRCRMPHEMCPRRVRRQRVRCRFEG